MGWNLLQVLRRRKPLLLSIWPGVLFSVQFSNFDRTIGLLLELHALTLVVCSYALSMLVAIYRKFKCIFKYFPKLNVLVKGNAGLLPECSIGNHSGGDSSGSTYGTLLLVCHSSYRPTINGRLLAAGLRWFQVRPMHKWHSQTLAIRLFIGASLSEPHTSVCGSVCVYVLVCLLAAIYRKF